MRLPITIFLLAIAGVLFAHADAATHGRTRVSEIASLVQVDNAVGNNPTEHRFLRTSKTVDGDTTSVEDDEERGLIDAAKKLKLEANIKIHFKALGDSAIKKDLTRFKRWYLSGKTPEDVWQDLKLAPLMKERFNMYGGIKQMKQEPKFQQYLNYEKFYKIIKRTYGKKA